MVPYSSHKLITSVPIILSCLFSRNTRAKVAGCKVPIYHYPIHLNPLALLTPLKLVALILKPFPPTHISLHPGQGQSGKSPPHGGSAAAVGLSAWGSQGGSTKPQHLRGTGYRGSHHGRLQEDVARPSAGRKNVISTSPHIHHAGGAGAGTSSTDHQEGDVPGGEMGSATDLSLLAM